MIGAGVAGVSAAYHLSTKGYQVLVLDEGHGPATGASAVAAGGMQRSNSFVTKASWISTIKSLIGISNDAGFRFFFMNYVKCFTDPHFLRFMTTFAHSSLTQPKVDLERRDALLVFTGYAMDLYEKMMSENPNLAKACDFQHRGAMMLNKQHIPYSLEKETYCENQSIAEEIEPHLKALKFEFQDAIYLPDAASSNSQSFTATFAQSLVDDPNVDITFSYQTRVESFDFNDQNNRILSIQTNNGIFDLTQNTEVIVAAGAWTPTVLWKCGLYCPVYPLKGYCCVLDDTTNPVPVKGIISDGTMFLSPLGTQLRVASMGEFDGWNPKPTEKVDAAFRKRALEIGVDLSPAPTYCGLRPLVADGGMIVGRVENWENLSLLVGPGFNGWKLGFGAGALLAQTLEGEVSEILDSSVMDSLSPQGRVVASPLWSKFSIARNL